MRLINSVLSKWEKRVLILSILLLFFAIPHTLEDFATGEPGKAGVPAPLLSLVVATIFAVQMIGIFWLGQKERRGLWVHVGVGLFWPVASGMAQLPTILSADVYRSGFVSILYVGGMIVVGGAMCLSAVLALREEAHPS